MDLATAHVLTALYALSHRIALTPAECKLLKERGTALSPDLWNETRKTLSSSPSGAARVPSSSLNLSRSYMNGSVFRTRRDSSSGTGPVSTTPWPEIWGTSLGKLELVRRDSDEAVAKRVVPERLATVAGDGAIVAVWASKRLVGIGRRSEYPPSPARPCLPTPRQERRELACDR